MPRERLTLRARLVTRLIAFVAFVATLFLCIISIRHQQDPRNFTFGLQDEDANNSTRLSGHGLRFDRRSDLPLYQQAVSDSSSDGSSDESEGSTGMYRGASYANQDNDGVEGRDLEARRANWDACFKRGSHIQSLIDMPSIPEAERTSFTNYDDLAKHGWTVTEKPVPLMEWETAWEGTLNKLELPDGFDFEDSEGWKYVECKHSEETTDAVNKKQQYPVSDSTSCSKDTALTSTLAGN